MFKIKYVTRLDNHELHYEREFDDRADDLLTAVARMQSDCENIDFYLRQYSKRKLKAKSESS